jgi:hypothetical protein
MATTGTPPAQSDDLLTAEQPGPRLFSLRTVPLDVDEPRTVRTPTRAKADADPGLPVFLEERVDLVDGVPFGPPRLADRFLPGLILAPRG